MSSANRKPFETATSLTQSLLDNSQDNLLNDIRMIADIYTNQARMPRRSCTISFASPTDIVVSYHAIAEEDPVIFETTGTLPAPLVVGTIYYAKNVTATGFNIALTVGGASINTSSSGSGSHQVSYGIGIIRVSDRNFYVGNKKYESRCKIPVQNRTIGEWLRPVVEFSQTTLSLNNTDSAFNDIAPGGENYAGNINKRIEIKVGLRDVAASYFKVFEGFVTDIGGFKRDISSLKYVARDKFDDLNVKIPRNKFLLADYPKIDDSVLNTFKPIIYGNYNEAVDIEGYIPCIVVNKRDPQLARKEIPATISFGSPTFIFVEDHQFDHDDKVQFTTSGTLPSGMALVTNYYIQYLDANNFNISLTPSGALVNTTDGGTGNHSVKAEDLVNVECVIADNDLIGNDSNEIWLVRSDISYRIASADVSIGAGNKSLTIAQNTGITKIGADNFLYDDSDVFLSKVTGKDIAPNYHFNIVSIVKNLLLTYTNITIADFDSNFVTYEDKTTPAISGIYNIKARAYIREEVSVLEYCLSLLEQVRLEMFIDRNQKLKLNAIHFENFQASPSFRVRDFDIIEGTLSTSSDERNNFNRVGAFYDFNPNPAINENTKRTKIYRNNATIAQQENRLISKAIEFPNLYVESDVINQTKEILKVASADIETIDCELTSRATLLDIGNFVKLNVQIGATIWENVPCMIREIGYSPDMKISLKMWSLQMLPFANPGGWDPGYSGIVGGDTSTISEE